MSMHRFVAAAAVGGLVLAACSNGGGEVTEAAPEIAAPTPTPTAAPAAGLVRCADVPEMTTAVEGSLGGRQNLDPIVAGVVATYVAEHPDTYAGRWIDRDRGGTFVLAFTDDPQPHLDALLARQPSPDDIPAIEPPPPITDDRPLGERDDVTIDVVQATNTEAALRSAQDALWPLHGDERFPIESTGVDTIRNRVFIGLIDPTPEQLTELEALVEPDLVCLDITVTAEPFSGKLRVIPEAGADPLVSCAGLGPFPYSRLLDPLPVADIDHPAVAALESEIDAPTMEGPLPEDGWVALAFDEQRALLAHFGADQIFILEFEPGESRWVLVGLGLAEQCDSQLALPDGLGPVELALDPNMPAPSPTDTQLHLVVSEMACASGQPVGERLVGPQVVETEDAVLIAYAATPRPGDQECPGNPWTPVVVELANPVGERIVADGLYVPPRPVEVSAD